MLAHSRGASGSEGTPRLHCGTAPVEALFPHSWAQAFSSEDILYCWMQNPGCWLWGHWAPEKQGMSTVQRLLPALCHLPCLTLTQVVCLTLSYWDCLDNLQWKMCIPIDSVIPVLWIFSSKEIIKWVPRDIFINMFVYQSVAYINQNTNTHQW